MKVKLVDDSNYQSGRSSSGGCYGFWVVAEQLPVLKDGQPLFEISYHTTADFDYCIYCGQFSCHCDKEPVIWTLDQVQKEIKEYNNDPSNEIYAIIEGELLEVDWKVVRRRIEDRLRKLNDNNILFKIAAMLDVKVW